MAETYWHGLMESYPGLKENDIWVDGDGKIHFIEDMGNSYRANVARVLRRHLAGYPLKDRLDDGLGNFPNSKLTDEEYDELKEIYELIKSKIEELEDI